MKIVDSKKVLESLLNATEAVPVEAPADVIANARALLHRADAPAGEIEALPEPLALALLENALRQKNARLVQALADSTHKPLAKAGKKAIYQLRSMGVAVAPAEPKRAAAPVATPSPAEDFPALLSPVTGMGERALLSVRPMRGGGLEALHFVFTDEAGLVHVERGEINRSAYRKQLKASKALLEITRERARQLLSSAAALNLSSGNPFPAGAEDALRHLEAMPKPGETPQLPALPAPTADDERIAAGGKSLHDEPEIAPWLPSEDQIRLFVQRLDEVMVSPLQLSEAQKQEQLTQKAQMTAHQYFTPEVKRRYAYRLDEMAEYFEHTGRKERADVARAEARRLFHNVSGTSRFAEYLFEKVLLLSAQAQDGQALPEPGQGLNQGMEQPPSERRSPGGLILP